MSLHTSRTVTTLKAMDKNEFKDFADFVQLPFSKSSPMVRRSFDYLKSCAPQFDKATCNKNLFSEKVLGQKLDTATGKEINRLLSELTAILERYLAMQFASADADVKNDALMRWYSKKKLYNHLDTLFKETEKGIMQGKFNDLRQVYNTYLQIKINYATLKGDRKQSFIVNRFYGTMLKNHYEIEDLQNKIGLKNLENIMSKELMAQMKKKLPSNFMVLPMKNELHYYRELLKFITNPDIPTYNFLLKCFDGDGLLISKFDKNRLLSILNNSVKKLFTDESYSIHVVALVGRMYKIKKELYKGYITPIPYGEMIINLCRLDRIDEAEAFQKEVGNKILGVKDVENFITGYRAQILFAKKQFADAMKLVSRCKAEDNSMGLDLRILKVKLAYELNSPILLEAHINTLRKFLATKVKKEMSPYFEKKVLPLNIFIVRLAKLQPGDKALLKLKKEIAAHQAVTEHRWLMEKVKEKLNTAR